MERNVLDHVKGFFQDDALPFGERRHAAAGRAACHQLDIGLKPAHELGGLPRSCAVLDRGLGADLPRSVHFVAQAPKLDAVRGRMPVLMP